MKNIYKKILLKIDLLEDLRISLLNFNFVMIYIIHKILVLIKNHLNYVRDNIFENFLRTIVGLFITYNDWKPKALKNKK